MPFDFGTPPPDSRSAALSRVAAAQRRLMTLTPGERLRDPHGRVWEYVKRVAFVIEFRDEATGEVRLEDIDQIRTDAWMGLNYWERLADV